VKPVFIEDNVLSSMEVMAALHASLPHVAGVRCQSVSELGQALTSTKYRA
jgi:hypothetical protein